MRISGVLKSKILWPQLISSKKNNNENTDIKIFMSFVYSSSLLCKLKIIKTEANNKKTAVINSNPISSAYSECRFDKLSARGWK